MLSLIPFRFIFTYFVLYNLDVALDWWLGWVPGSHRVMHYYHAAWQALVPWVGKNIFHIERAITDSGWIPADSTFGWLRVFCIIVIAIASTLVWSILDRKRSNYAYLQEWFRLYLRLILAQYLISYGTIKLFKQQFPDISLTTLQKTVGEETPMCLLWNFMGYSRWYCLFGGLAEVIPALLLLTRRLTLLGGLLSAAVMTNVFLLNLCYDVRDKLFSLHLLLMAIVLIAPDLKRLYCILVLNRPTDCRQAPPFFQNAWLNTLVILLPFFVAGNLLWFYSWDGLRNLYAEKPPLYGIWETKEFKLTLSGKALPVLATDRIRWQQLIFERPNWVYLKSPDRDAMMFIQLSSDRKTISLGQISNSGTYLHAKRFNQQWEPVWLHKNVMTLDEHSKDWIELKGPYFGYFCEATLQRIDETKMPLLKQQFRWITEPEEYLSQCPTAAGNR